MPLVRRKRPLDREGGAIDTVRRLPCVYLHARFIEYTSQSGSQYLLLALLYRGIPKDSRLGKSEQTFDDVFLASISSPLPLSLPPPRQLCEFDRIGYTQDHYHSLHREFPEEHEELQRVSPLLL